MTIIALILGVHPLRNHHQKYISCSYKESGLPFESNGNMFLTKIILDIRVNFMLNQDGEKNLVFRKKNLKNVKINKLVFLHF